MYFFKIKSVLSNKANLCLLNVQASKHVFKFFAYLRQHKAQKCWSISQEFEKILKNQLVENIQVFYFRFYWSSSLLCIIHENTNTYQIKLFLIRIIVKWNVFLCQSMFILFFIWLTIYHDALKLATVGKDGTHKHRGPRLIFFLC